MKLNTKLLLLFQILIWNVLNANTDLKLQDSTNILIYKDTENDTSLLLQLISKNGNHIMVKSCEVYGRINDISLLKFGTLDSVLNSRIKNQYIKPQINSLIIDTLIINYDSVFFANNSVFSLKNQLFYVKFNSGKVEEPYSIEDYYSIFVLKIDSAKSNVKFWSSDYNRSFSYPFYIFKRNFWYISFCKNEFTNSCFILNYFNGIDVKKTSMEILQMLE